MSTLDIIEAVLIIAATVAALVFCIVYTILAPWWRTQTGRHLMSLTAGLAALGTVSILRRWIGQWDGYEVTVTIIYGVLAWELWRRVYLLLTAQGALGKHRHDHEQGDSDA